MRPAYAVSSALLFLAIGISVVQFSETDIARVIGALSLLLALVLAGSAEFE